MTAKQEKYVTSIKINSYRGEVLNGTQTAMSCKYLSFLSNKVL